MLTKNSLIVTTSWDDGTITDLKLAELLEKYGITGTFYVSKSIDSPLQDRDIVAIDKKFEIGSHTLSHPDLTKVSLSEAKKEIGSSKTYLEDLLGHPVFMFCYPYGRYNDRLKEIVKEHGFIGARTCEPGGLSLPQDPYQWHITLFASNGSPRIALRICRKARLWKIEALFDWESRAKILFDLALKEGGIYHLYGHSIKFERSNSWDKLERVLEYLSKREKVQYLTNSQIFQRLQNEVAK